MADTCMSLDVSQNALLSNKEIYIGLPYQYRPEMDVAIFTQMCSGSDGMVYASNLTWGS